MKTIQKIALLITAFPILAFAESSSFSLGKMRKASLTKGSIKSFGTNSGGGGGGVCSTSKCQTLAQAGFRVPVETPHTSHYELETQVIEEVGNIMEAMPLNLKDENRGYIREGIIGGKDQFLWSSDPNSKEFKVYREEYINLLQNQGKQVDVRSFELLAATIVDPSERSKTYLFSGYLKLTTRGKALLLIHEYNIKNGNNLEDTLMFDGYLQDYLQKRDNNQLANFDYWSFIHAAAKVDFADIKEDLKGQLLFALLNDPKVGKIRISDLCNDNYKNGGTCRVDRSKALRLRSLHPKFAEVFTNASIMIWIYSPHAKYANEKSQAQIAEFCKKQPADQDSILTKDLNDDGFYTFNVFACDLKVPPSYGITY